MPRKSIDRYLKVAIIIKAGNDNDFVYNLKAPPKGGARNIANSLLIVRVITRVFYSLLLIAGIFSGVVARFIA